MRTNPLNHDVADEHTDCSDQAFINEVQESMDFDNAIKAHTRWKQRLAAYIDNPDLSLSTSEVSSDKTCDLGEWIYGEGGRLSHMPEFKLMKEAHTRFHAAAGEVVRRADAGQKLAEEIALGAASPYASASTAVVSAVMAMKRVVLG